MNTEEVLAQIRTEMKSFSDVEIYYALRKYRFKYIRMSTVEMVKWCLAIDKLGIPITTKLIQYLINAPESQFVLTMLHRLGDKKVLLLKREVKTICHHWLIDPNFKNKLHRLSSIEKVGIEENWTYQTDSRTGISILKVERDPMAIKKTRNALKDLFR